MEQKKCTKCKLEKNVDCFYKNAKSKDGLRSDCIDCRIKYKKENSQKIKEQNKLYNERRKNQKKEWAQDNREKVELSRKKWLDNNKDYVKKNSKEYNHLWYQKNKEYRKEYAREKQKIYRLTNPLFKLKQNLRRRINRYIKNKSSSTESILGINYEDFLIYIQNKFTEGMTLEKLGREIHIDHIIPLASAKTEEELYNLCHYTNLQPLWAKDNLRKSTKVDYL
jgi:hypothetical protein